MYEKGRQRGGRRKHGYKLTLWRLEVEILICRIISIASPNFAKPMYWKIGLESVQSLFNMCHQFLWFGHLGC
jgi:hypothetical protein